MDSYEKQRAENFMVCELLKWTEIIDNLKKICFREYEGDRSTHQICL